MGIANQDPDTSLMGSALPQPEALPKSATPQPAETTATAASAQTTTKFERLRALGKQLEVWGELLSDILNPILIKEVRQSLKSRQFGMIFMITLILCWGWSILGTADPDVARSSKGGEIFKGYYGILSFPLLIAVPFGAFRGISSEREDRTFDLIQITAIRPRNAVMGKILSAVAQIVVYLSAAAPCMAFTYMLRGIDLATIANSLALLIAAALLLTAYAVFLGTVSPERHWNTALSVILAAGLFLAWWGFLFTVLGYEVMVSMDLGAPLAQGFMVGVLLFAVNYFLLFVIWASARLTFPSDNRDFAWRIMLQLHPIIFFSWMGFMAYVDGVVTQPTPMRPAFALMCLFLASAHWALFGLLMIGDSSEIPDRVRRGLPQSLVGRICLTWFNPGPHTGYCLVVTNLVATLIMTTAFAIWLSEMNKGVGFPPGIPGSPDFGMGVLVGGGAIVSYIIAFLGLGLFITQFARRRSPEIGPAMGTVSTVLLVLGSTAIPSLVEYFRDRPSWDWHELHTFNPFWTISEMFQSLDGGTVENWIPVTGTITIAAMAAFCLNLPGIVREIHLVRTAKPQRVVDEEQASGPFAVPQKLSPWDDPAAVS